MGGSQSIEKTRTFSGCYAVDQFNYDWSIPKFQKLLSNGVGHAVNSDILTVKVGTDNDAYKVVLYPNGYNERVKGYASLYLEKVSDKERLINFSCTLVDAEGRQLLKKAQKQVLGMQTVLGWTTFCNRNVLLEEDVKVLKDDTLMLKCSLCIFGDAALANPESVDGDPSMSTSLSELSTDLGLLLVEETFSDFILIVENEKFHVHRSIMSARSPIFKVLLHSPLTDKNFIKITDISKPILQELLNFMYSGNVSHLNVQESSDLYYAADKYEMTSLKNICSKVLKANLEVDNVLNVLLLSEKHSDLDLKEVCIQYIVKNVQKVRKQNLWLELMKNQTDLANFIFERAVSESKPT